MKIFVVIATYNEKENIKKLLEEILLLGIADLNIIVVDDDSPDGTSQIVEKFSDPRVTLITRKSERGYGQAHIVGFSKAIELGAEVIISMDADFSHQPSSIKPMVEKINQGYDLVVGSRRVPGGKIIGWGLFRITASNTAMILTRLILSIKTRDVTSGFRAYKVSKLQEVDFVSIKSNGYSFLEELIYYCERKGFKVFEQPITFNDRQLGKSKFSFKEIIKFFITIISLKLKKLPK